jgi:outer membrane protein OmpA-like peptidoglycan-associated protein
MAEDWLVDVRKYASDADEAVVAAITRYCGIALNSRDSALVAFSDPKETEQVREGFLKKKLALNHEDAVLDSAISAVGQRMKADRTKNRVTVYYLLAEHFGLLGLFGAAAPAVPVATLMNQQAPAASLAPTLATASATASARAVPADDGIFGFGILTFATVIGSVMFAMVVAGQIVGHVRKDAPALVSSAPAPAPVSAPAPAPSGAGVVAEERNGKPVLTTYFDSDKAVVAADFQTQAAAVLAYLKDNPAATAAISGFNDPTGNAAHNAELSKNRAQAVQAALVAAGVDKARTALVKPAEATTATVTPAEARRVEVTIAE